MPHRLLVNGQLHTIDAPADTPLLWALRDDLALTGTKYGCGIGACGACTVHVDGQPVRSCSIAIGMLAAKRVTTVEGLTSVAMQKLQQAWIESDVPQCGYCQVGQLMSAAALLARIPSPTDADIDAAMSGNLCRCGTYQRIRQAVHHAAATR